MHDTTEKFIHEAIGIQGHKYEDLTILSDRDESTTPFWEIYISYNGSADEEFRLGNTHLVRELMAILASHCSIEATIEQACSQTGDVVDWAIEAYVAERFEGESPIYRLQSTEETILNCSWNSGGDPAAACDNLLDGMDLLCHQHRKAVAELNREIDAAIEYERKVREEMAEQWQRS